MGKTIAKWIAAWCTVATCLFCCCGSGLAGNVVEAVRTEKAPSIDGKLDEECWKAAKPVTAFTILDTDKPSAFKTTAYVLYSDTCLYVGVQCMDPDMSNLVANATSKKVDAEGVFRDDCVEIMIDPGLSRNNYLHFAVSAGGARYDRYCVEGGLNGIAQWNGEWKAKTFIGKDFWSCEAAFPFFALGITKGVGTEWGINICREKKKPFENSSIAEQGAFNVAGRFAKLEGIAVDFNEYCYTVSPPVLSIETKDEKLYTTITVVVENNTGKKKDVQLDCALYQNEDNVLVKSQAIICMPDGKTNVAISPFILDAQGAYQAQVTLRDPQTRKVYYYSQTKEDVKYVPMAIKLIEPFYRDAVFETQNLEDIVFDLKINLSEKELLNKNIAITVQKEGADGVCAEKQITAVRKVNQCKFSCKELPYGNLLIKAVIKDEKDTVIAETTQRLQKLPYKKGEVWLGRDRNLYVDGKPFFYNLVWPACVEDDNPYYTAYASMVKSGGGKKHVAWTFGTSGQVSILIKSGLNQGLKDFLIKIVRDNIDDPDCLGYYLADEPNNMPIEAVEDCYRFLREQDPYHPVILSQNNQEALRNLMKAADVHSFHCYPVIRTDRRINDLSRIIGYAKSFLDITEGKKFIPFLDQAFNYGDGGMVNQRIHNYPESRSKKLLAVICGVKGIIFYNRGYNHYPELYIGAPYNAQELAYLGKAIMAPDSSLPVKTSSPTAKTLLKEVNGELYLFVVNADMAAREMTITVPGLQKRADSLQVVSEDRTVATANDLFTDRFDVFEVHVYTTSKAKTGLTSVNAIEEKIDAINKARRKPGNLAFQMVEGGGGVTFKVSSHAYKSLREDNALWHVTDGIIDKKIDNQGVIWQDATPNVFPDWIEIKLPQAHAVGRVVVYPVDKSLKDYSVQAFVDGEWKEVDKVTGKEEEMITHTFNPVNTDRIRIWITATKGPNSKIAEIEIYEK